MTETKFTKGPWGLDVGFESSRPGDFDEYWQVHDGHDAIACPQTATQETERPTPT